MVCAGLFQSIEKIYKGNGIVHTSESKARKENPWFELRSRLRRGFSVAEVGVV